MDRVWWDKYRNDVAHVFYGRRISPNKSVPGTDFIDFFKGGNSGAGAMSLAKYFGATRIILLGYDCKYADCGKRHWHGDWFANHGAAQIAVLNIDGNALAELQLMEVFFIGAIRAFRP